MKLVLRKKPAEGTTSGRAISIDPGLGGTGWAVWSLNSFQELVPPIESGSVIAHNKDAEWWVRMDEISDHIANICFKHSVIKGWMELPSFMEGGSGAGMAAARRGDLVKLVALFGSIAGRCMQRTRSPYVFNGVSAELTPVDVAEWKGQLPKDICHDRIRKRLPGWEPKTKTTHEMDAVGIGLFAKKHF